MSLLWTLFVGGLIGWIAGMLVGRDVPGGVIGNVLAGFLGAWFGGLVLGEWGPIIGGFAIIPAILGAIILLVLLNFMKKSAK